MEMINDVVKIINKVLWDYILLFLLCGTGIFFTFRLRFVQIRKFKEGIKSVFSCFTLKGDKADKHGMSSFQALATAIAAQVGTGNIAGAATAIVSGGPVYYIKAAFSGTFGKICAAFFSIAIILALGFMGNMVQSNSISTSFEKAFGISPVVTGVICALVAAFVFMGGRARIASLTEKIVPVMAFLYIIGCLIVIFMCHDNIISSFKLIFVMAFNPKSVAGGVAGITVKSAMRYGIARGLFSNEAGMGSTPHAHALAKVNHPTEQGVVAMIGVFIDTFVILTLTAIVIISTGVWNSGVTGAALAQTAFCSVFGNFGDIFIAICMLFFAFSTIIGWYFFGETNIKYLFGNKFVKIYTVIVCLFIAVGAVLHVELVWDMSDMFNGLMVLPNLIALLALSNVVKKISDEGEQLDR